jgi:hypothetical protein
MKKLVFTLLGLLLYLSSFAQYESFFGKNSTTFRQFKGMIPQYDKSIGYMLNALNAIGCNYELSFSKNDTVIINDTLYHKATINIVPFDDDDAFFGRNCENCTDCEYFTLNTFFREDTINGRLYRKDFTSHGIYTKEILVCDMSLQAHDKFMFIGYTLGYYTTIHYNDYELVVDSVGYINDKKVIYFGCDIAAYYTEYNEYGGGIGETTKIKLQFIEGIGPTHAINSYGDDIGYYVGNDGIPVLAFGGARSHFLLCKYLDDTLTFMTNLILGCFQEGTWNPVNVKQNKVKTEIHCHVENNILYISFPENVNIQQGELYIIDFLGRMRYNKRINNNPEQVNISDLSLGLYILVYSDGKNKLQTKFINNN